MMTLTSLLVAALASQPADALLPERPHSQLPEARHDSASGGVQPTVLRPGPAADSAPGGAPVQAAGAAPAAGASRPSLQTLRWHPDIDGAAARVLVTGWVVSELAVKRSLAPPACRWCAPNAFDTGARRLFNPGLAFSEEGDRLLDAVSTVLGFGILPATLLAIDAWSAHEAGVFQQVFWVDTLLVVEATFAALALTQVTKFLVGRARPYTVGAPRELLESAHGRSDQNLSFFSGHTSLAFSLVCASATIATLRGSRHAWLAWAAGIPLALATATLRLAADKHWLSDVLVGAAVGAAVGVGLPALFHRPVESAPGGLPDIRLLPAPSGLALHARF